MFVSNWQQLYSIQFSIEFSFASQYFSISCLFKNILTIIFFIFLFYFSSYRFTWFYITRHMILNMMENNIIYKLGNNEILLFFIDLQEKWIRCLVSANLWCHLSTGQCTAPFMLQPWKHFQERSLLLAPVWPCQQSPRSCKSFRLHHSRQQSRAAIVSIFFIISIEYWLVSFFSSIGIIFKEHKKKTIERERYNNYKKYLHVFLFSIKTFFCQF